MEYSTAHRLAREIRESEEYRTYHRLKDEIMGDETLAALIKEYRRLQVAIQMAAVSGQQPSAEDTQRFQSIGVLLYGKPECAEFLLSEMRLQQAMADIFRIITEAADLDLSIPGLG